MQLICPGTLECNILQYRTLIVVFLLDHVALLSITELCLKGQISFVLPSSFLQVFLEGLLISSSNSLMHLSTEHLITWCRASISQSVKDCETFMFYQPVT